MISMTGFAFKELAEDSISLSVEIKSYNNRFLEIFINMPPWLSHLEPKVRELIGNYCNRGKIEVSIRLKEQNIPMKVSVNASAAAAYMNAISSLASELGIDEKIWLSKLLEMEGVLEIEKNRNDDRYWSIIEPLLNKTAEAFRAERSREGKKTEEDIIKHIDNIETALVIIKNNISNIENSIKENIISRFNELTANNTEIVIDENRVLAETAMLLMKYTINEEVSRLSSHLAEFRAETERNESPGKKLDFLCQEINREINTIGSKSALLEVSRAVVEMKESLENVREQLRNIE